MLYYIILGYWIAGVLVGLIIYPRVRKEVNEMMDEEELEGSERYMAFVAVFITWMLLWPIMLIKPETIFE